MTSTALTFGHSRGLAPRRFARQPILFARADCGGISGVVLNLSESGLCMQCDRPLPLDSTVPLRLQTRHTERWFEARARIVWRAEQEQLAGLTFVGLSEQALEEVRLWLDFGSRLRELRAEWSGSAALHRRGPHWLDLFRAQPATPVEETPETIAAWRKVALPESKAGTLNGGGAGSENVSRVAAFSKTLWRMLDQRLESASNWQLALGAALVASLFFGFAVLGPRYSGLYARAAAKRISQEYSRLTHAHLFTLAHRTPSAVAPTPQTQPKNADVISNSASLTTAPPSDAIPVLPTDVARNAPPSQTSTSAGITAAPATQIPARAEIPALSPAPPARGANIGLLLQVEALRNADNAQRTVRDLQRQNFPVFVYQHDAHDLYKILVGPFVDQQSLAATKAALEKLGLHPIERKAPQ
jgi:cell division septation protein DedD